MTGWDPYEGNPRWIPPNYARFTTTATTGRPWSERRAIEWHEGKESETGRTGKDREKERESEESAV